MTLLLPAAHLHVGGAAVTTLSFVDAVTTDNQSLTAMTGINAGDLLVWHDYAAFALSPVVPSGFTQIGTTQSLNEADAVTAYKIAIGNESGTLISGMNGSEVELKLLLQFRGNSPITVVADQDIAQQITDGNPASQTCNASGGAVPLIVFGTYASIVRPVDPRTFSPAADGEHSIAAFSGAQAVVKYKIYNSSPQDISIDMNDEGSNNVLQSFFLEVE